MAIELYKSKNKSYKCIYLKNCEWYRCRIANIKFCKGWPHFRVEFLAFGIVKWNGSVEFRFFNICLVVQYG